MSANSVWEPGDTAYFPDLVRDRARTKPDEVWLRNVEGDSQTWAQFDFAARQWAAGFARLGVKPADNVLVMLPDPVTVLTSWIGLTHLGAVQVPVNTDYRGRMLAHIMTDSQAAVLVVHADYLDRVGEIRGELPRLQHLIVVGPESSVAPSHEAADAWTDVKRLPEAEFLSADALPADGTIYRPWDISLMLYTSGTTGPSKGVLMPWAQLHEVSRAFLPIEDLTSADTVYCPLPLFHLAGRILVYLGVLIDAPVVLRGHFSGTAYWDDVRRFGCRTTILMGTMGAFLQAQPERSDDADNPLYNVFMAPAPENLDQFRKRFGVRIGTAFNMTETSCPIISDKWNVVDPRSVGRVREGFEVQVVDEFDQPVPRGVAGELVVRSTRPWTLMAGYWNRPEATAQAWRNLWFHTGDALVWREDGEFAFMDRLKDAIRRRGENISSAEVEFDVAADPDVAEVAAIPVPSAWGDDEVMIFVVPERGASVEPSLLHSRLSARMPRFMVPRYIQVVDELPKTGTSKVRKAELRERGVGPTTWDAEHPD